MALGAQGRGSRFTDKKEAPEQPNTNVPQIEGQEGKPKWERVGMCFDVDLIARLNAYVYERKNIKGDKSANASSVTREALELFLEKEGF